MTRAALYARYSSDNQSEASIEDQFRLCREHAARERWQIVGSYEDAAISGSSTILRPGIQRLMRDAQHREFNILLAEALDRISRDQADLATLYKHLKFAGVTIVTLAEGEISELHVGLAIAAPTKSQGFSRHSPLSARSARSISRATRVPWVTPKASRADPTPGNGPRMLQSRLSSVFTQSTAHATSNSTSVGISSRVLRIDINEAIASSSVRCSVP